MAHAPKINQEADRMVNIVLLREGGVGESSPGKFKF